MTCCFACSGASARGTGLALEPLLPHKGGGRFKLLSTRTSVLCSAVFLCSVNGAVQNPWCSAHCWRQWVAVFLFSARIRISVLKSQHLFKVNNVGNHRSFTFSLWTWSVVSPHPQGEGRYFKAEFSCSLDKEVFVFSNHAEDTPGSSKLPSQLTRAGASLREPSATLLAFAPQGKTKPAADCSTASGTAGLSRV